MIIHLLFVGVYPMHANGWRYAAYRLILTNFQCYKYTLLIHLIFMFTANCGMQYERVLYAGISIS